MFFSQKKSLAARSSVIGPLPWDDKTCEKLAGSDRFNVMVTSITRTVTSGRMQEEIVTTARDISFEVHGLIIHPKYIIVQFEFSERNGGPFGFFSYDSMDCTAGLDKRLKLPLMHVYLSDPKIAFEMYEGHRCALMSGRHRSFVRVWKRKGEGLMTALDKKHGSSYESRYEIFGITTWCELESCHVPNWALPVAHEKFSIRDLPESTHRMRLD
jgi:hypothetical protein